MPKKIRVKVRKIIDKKVNLSTLKKQLIKFTLIGLLAVFVDMASYYVLLNIFPLKMSSFFSNEAIAKTLSFICGMSITYTFNKLWTWKKSDKSKKRFAKFACLYGASLIINVSVNSFLLYLLYDKKELIDLPFKYLIAFIGATGISASVNFIGQKTWVFKSVIE